MKELWANTNTGVHQLRLHAGAARARGEVLVAWDHVARLVDAPKAQAGRLADGAGARAAPRAWATCSSSAGLGIPKGAPDRDKAKDVDQEPVDGRHADRHALRPNAFFPTVEADPPAGPACRRPAGGHGGRGPADAEQRDPRRCRRSVWGRKDGEVSQIFKNSFKEICIDRTPRQVHAATPRVSQLNAILAELKVPCWAPDPVQPGQVCKVGLMSAPATTADRRVVAGGARDAIPHCF